MTYRLTVTRVSGEDANVTHDETFYTLHDAWQAALSAMPCDQWAKGYVAGLQQGGVTGSVYADGACEHMATVLDVAA